MRKGGDGQQEDFKPALGKEWNGTGIWLERDGGLVWREEVWRIRPQDSPTQPIYAGFIGVGVRLVHIPTSLGFASTRLVGLLLRDVVFSTDDVRAH